MQITREWRKSSKSIGAGPCVETRLVYTYDGDEEVEVRNSNRIEAGSVFFTKDEWRAFIAGVKDEEFEV